VPSVRETLEAYVAGRVKAERVVEAVAAAYYGRDPGGGMRDALRPVIEMIERAHPGVIELSGTVDKPGFAVRLANRPFPKEYEGALREAVEGALAGAASVGAQHAAPLHGSAAPSPTVAARNPGFVARLFGAIRRLFSASA
jgi:hypothetical protein